jgi:methionine biosynthesis protein MetW
MSFADYYEKQWETTSIDERTMQVDLKEIKKHVYGNLLDAGCGNGLMLKEFSKSEKVKGIYGIDISENAIAKARENAPNAILKVADVGEIPFNDEQFDCIVASELIEHVFDTEKMFNEFRRVLVPSGRLIITTPNQNFWKNFFNLVLGRYEIRHSPYAGHIRFYTKKSLKNVLNDFNFTIIKIKNIEYLHHLIPKTMIAICQK